MAKNLSTSGYMQQNLNRLIKGVKMHVKDVITPSLTRELTSVAQQIVGYIDNGANIPEHLGHLHDATGIGVYVNGTMQAFIPTKHAGDKLGKSGYDGINHYGINGQEFLQQAIAEASTRFASGIWFVLFSAVPYAFYVDAYGSPIGRGLGFFKNIKNLSVSSILAGLRAIPGASVTAQSATV